MCIVNSEIDIAEKRIVLKFTIVPVARKKASVSIVAPQQAARTDCLISPKNFTNKVIAVTCIVENNIFFSLVIAILAILLFHKSICNYSATGSCSVISTPIKNNINIKNLVLKADNVKSKTDIPAKAITVNGNFSLFFLIDLTI